MNRLNSKICGFVIAAVISALTIAPILITDHAAKAADTSVGKTLQCDTTKHTKDYCDGFTVGKTDCRDGRTSMLVIARLTLLTGKVGIEQAGLALVATYRK